MTTFFHRLWQGIRRLSGDGAYERYLEHHARCHADKAGEEDPIPLSRAEFFKQWQKRKWDGIKRCC